MIIIAGLGNPGDQYARSRHNVGFMVLDQIAQKMSAGVFSLKPKLRAELLKQSETVLVKPQTFMNNSGEAVRAVIDYYTDWDFPTAELPALFVIHDDLDIPVGAYKFQFGTGPKQHNGLLSLYQHLGTDQFWHVRIGVDGRNGDRSVPSDAYVLQPPSADELRQLAIVFDQIIRELQAKTQTL